MKNNRPKIVLFKEDEQALNYAFKLKFPLNHNISIKSFDYDIEEFKNSGIKIMGEQPSIDSVYYLHPYRDNVYIHGSILEETILEEKMNLYRKVGALLGAKYISTEVSQSESQKITIDREGNVKVQLIKAGGDVKNARESYNKQLNIVKEVIELKENFDLNKNIDELNAMIDKLNLHHEIGITSLISSRDSRSSGVSLKSKSIISELSSEYRRLLEVSAHLSSSVFDIQGSFKKSLEEVKTLKIKIEFEF